MLCSFGPIDTPESLGYISAGPDGGGREEVA
jgi:hypothetical protein